MSDLDARAALRALQRCDWQALSADGLEELVRAVNAERARRLMALHEGESFVTIRTRYRTHEGQAVLSVEDIERSQAFTPLFSPRGPLETFAYRVPGLGATHRLLASAHCMECGGSRSIRPGTNDEGSIPCPRCQS